MIKIVKTAKFSTIGLSNEVDAIAATTVSPSSVSSTKQIESFNKNETKGNEGRRSVASQEAATKSTTATEHNKLAKPDNLKVSSREWTDDLQADYERILCVGEECITPEELKTLLLKKGRASNEAPFILYDGFEPSGRMHIAQGVFKAMNVNKCTYAGTNAVFCFWVADWFALMNDKMGGDLDKIRTVGKYLIEVWKAAGMNLEHVVFKWASAEITEHADIYWPLMLDIARRFTITRIKKCCQIMGRLEGSLTAAQILYPIMQCTDVFFLKADICQLGVDQRKVNMLAREYCDAGGVSRKQKPIILSHHMLYGLKKGQEKMSKSDPDSAVFMEDYVEDVERKIMNAFCPTTVETASIEDKLNLDDVDDEAADAGKASLHLTKDDLKNPCLDYIQNIIFSPPDATFSAGTTTYTDFFDVRQDFLSGNLTETDLKQGLISALNSLLEPVRKHFTNDSHARQLLELVQKYKNESKNSPSPTKTLRRLNLVELGKVPAGTHVVFAPLPSPTPTLQEVVSILAQLNSIEVMSSEPRVLFLSDWSARVCNACQADSKIISAYYNILLVALKALNPTLMGNVQVVMQSEAILADPSNYWISVINIGRHFMLNRVMGNSLKDGDGVGHVIARLLRIADIAGLEPSSIALDDEETAKSEAELLQEFFQVHLPNLSVPQVYYTNGISVRLQPERELDALKTENDEYFLLDDPKVHGKSKIKKAFCEPGNIIFCPPIALSAAFALPGGATVPKDDEVAALLIQRAVDNGGDKAYQSLSLLKSDFEKGDLHPGDLKTAVSSVMLGVLEQISSAMKVDATASKASKDLKAFIKKTKKVQK